MSQFVYIHDCAAVNVTTSAYLEIEASTTDSCSSVQFFFYIGSSALGLASLAVGAVGDEVDILLCSQKVGTAIPSYIQNGSRLSLKAVGSNITSGYIVVTLIP
jgi:hypothetical protein